MKIRSPWFTTLALALVAWLSLLGAFLPDAPPDVHAQTRGSVSSSMDARARWESLSAEERTQVVYIFHGPFVRDAFKAFSQRILHNN